jgi:hypothetical protein
LVGNEENEYPVPDSDRMMLILNNKWNDIHKKTLKEEIMNEIIEIVIEKLQVQLNRKYKMNSKNIKTPQTKNLRRHRNN